jgi:general secretion pathway protein M
VLLLGSLALGTMVLYAFAWRPFAAAHARLGQAVADQRALVAWMTVTGAEIRRLREQAPEAAASGQEGQSLLASVDATSRAAGLGKSTTRIQPEGTQTVRVWLEKAPFDAVVGWLLRLEREAGVQVESISVEAAEGKGLVNARVGLIRPESS